MLTGSGEPDRSLTAAACPRFRSRAGVASSAGLRWASLFSLALYSTYYQVNADEVGVVQRFGRYVRSTDPGPHLKIPSERR